MSEQSSVHGQGDALFLRQRHGQQFEALSRITGEAVGILAVRALSRNVRSSDIQSDTELLTQLSAGIDAATTGPLAAEDALRDWNDKRAPLTAGAVAINAQLNEAPIRTTRLEYLPNILSHTAGSNAREYLSDVSHEGFMDIATGRFSHYYGAQSRVELISNNRFYIRAPIGEYGPEAALDLLKATYRTMVGPTTNQLARLDALADTGDNRALILAHTSYGRQHRTIHQYDESDGVPLGMALARTVYEGDLSIQQGISLLTAQRVRGFDTLASLWGAIRRAKLVEKLTSLLPFGNLAPANDMNVFIPDLVVPSRPGEVRLRSSVENELRAYKAQVRAKLADYYRRHPTAPAGNDMGIMCPALVRGAGLTERHDVLYARFTGKYPPVRNFFVGSP